ncbi:hypothetical protein [Streptomyces olivaceus]|uniref:hypothetical protein n=1 Tax=Streptomyces olivaceus TaxID=47716 RepID=UPI001CCA06DB|nr:hypothetical protein [Streptomyces olivaceus]
MEESGFATQDKAIARLTEIYNAKKAAPRGQTKAERIARYGSMRFEEYSTQWKAGQRDLGPASVAHLESLLNIHLLPLLGSRRMNTFDHRDRGCSHSLKNDPIPRTRAVDPMLLTPPRPMLTVCWESEG